VDYLENEVGAAIKDGLLPVVCIQEHGKTGDWYNECSGGLGKKGWKCCGAAALRTCANGASAGVAVFLPACVEVRLAPGQSGWDISPTGSSGRLCLTLAKLGKVGWVAVFSAYFWTGVTLGDLRNARILDAITGWVKALRIPWIVGADWQNAPEQLEASPWQQLTGGAVFAPNADDGGTCRSGGRESTIDYFWGDHRLARLVTSVVVNGDAPYSPHKPVILTTASAWRGNLVRVAVRPKPFPQVLPQGCAVLPPNYGGAEAISSQAELDDAWKAFNQAAETEIQGLLQMDDVTFAPFAGRGGAPRYAWKLDMPGEHSATGQNPDARAWRWLDKELAWATILGCHWQRHPEEAEGKYGRQWRACWRKLLGNNCHWRAIGAAWRDYLQGNLRLLWPRASSSPAVLQGMRNMQILVAGEAARRERALIAARASSFKQRIAEHFPGSAGLLHRVTKWRGAWLPQKKKPEQDLRAHAPAGGHREGAWRMEGDLDDQRLRPAVVEAVTWPQQRPDRHRQAAQHLQGIQVAHWNRMRRLAPKALGLALRGGARRAGATAL
jgi:hypothetical protein